MTGNPRNERLDRYRELRDFGVTPEPTGEEVTPPSAATRFVVQEHHATSLHWDLRLERDGTLASWAVPRGIPPDPRQNHLAVRTEDHPLMYLGFSGEIPAGEYGAGPMTIWDSGTYTTEKWSDDEVMVVFAGQRTRGRHVLFRTGDRNWMIHRMDPAADPTREEMPDALAPMLATPGSLPADESKWAFEVKWDGVRAVCFAYGGRVRLVARSGVDVTSRYPELAALGRALGTVAVILDGEVVALDDAGRPSFERLQRRMHVTSEPAIRRLRRDVPVAYAIFDLLWLEGHATTALPYSERRRLLEGLGLAGPNWHVPPSHPGEGTLLVEATAASGLEGVVAKRLDSAYEPGVRSRNWLKVKHQRSADVVVGGWLPGVGSRARLGALLVGVYGADGRLAYAGRVGTGFPDAELDRLGALLAQRERDAVPFDPPPPREVARHARWVAPDLVARVAFTEWTAAGAMRHPSYKGLLDDRPAGQVVREPG